MITLTRSEEVRQKKSRRKALTVCKGSRRRYRMREKGETKAEFQNIGI